MAWALAFDDTLGTYAELPAPPAPSGNYKFIFTIHRFTTPFTGNWVFTQSNSTSVRGLELEDIFLRVYSGGFGAPFYFDTAWGDNETRVIEATFRNGDLEVDFNVIDDASGTATYPSSIPFSSDHFTVGARRGGATPQNPNFVKIEYIDLNNSANNRTWDATASDHSNTGAQPVLVDTIGNNNATGVNFPTDGSAWVDLGGGTISSSVSVTWPMFEVSAVQASEAPAISSSVSVTWPMFEVSAVQASEAPAISSSVNVTWSMFEVSAAQASEAPAISSSVAATWSMFEVSAVVGKFDYYTDPSARIEINSASRRIDINSASRRIDINSASRRIDL